MKFYQSLFLGCALTGLCAACSTSKKSDLAYFQDLQTIEEGTLAPMMNDLKIVPNDELVITVNSLIPDASLEFNMPLANPATRGQLVETQQPRQQTYIVDAKGDIQFPKLGTIHVAGMTTEGLREYLTKEISKSVEDPFVKVQLVSFCVNVLGEVASPGRKGIGTERFSILDAIAAAGDITPYGKRDNVLLVREENGQRTFHRFDLTSSEALKSPYFYLQQNDVVYVEPNKIRTDNAKYNQNNAYKLSVISTIVSACSVVASLIIALAIK